MKNLMLFLLIGSSTTTWAAGLFGKSLVEKKVEELREDRERIERFVERADTSRSSCHFFYSNFNERKAKTIADTLASKKKIKDAYLFDEIEDLSLEYCETLPKENYYDP